MRNSDSQSFDKTDIEDCEFCPASADDKRGLTGIDRHGPDMCLECAEMRGLL